MTIFAPLRLGLPCTTSLCPFRIIFSTHGELNHRQMSGELRACEFDSSKYRIKYPHSTTDSPELRLRDSSAHTHSLVRITRWELVKAGAVFIPPRVVLE
jgi:hypothetical protein